MTTSDSEAPQGHTDPTGSRLGESRSIVHLGDLTTDDLEALSSTVPEPDWKPANATGTAGGAALGYMTYEFFDNVQWALALLALGFTYDLVGTLTRKGVPKTQPPKLRHAGAARRIISQALVGSDDARRRELHVISYLDRETVAFQIPDIAGDGAKGHGAEWFAPPPREDAASRLRDVVALRALGIRLLHATDAPAHHAWSRAWRDHRPAVRKRASSRASKLADSMVEIAKLLDPIVRPCGSAAEALETLRRECTRAVVIYCEVSPSDTNVVLPSGTTATDTFADLLDVVVKSARRINSDAPFTASDAASVRQRLSEVRFTRSDLELP